MTVREILRKRMTGIQQSRAWCMQMDHNSSIDNSSYTPLSCTTFKHNYPRNTEHVGIREEKTPCPSMA